MKHLKKFNEVQASRIGDDSRIPKSTFSSEFVDSLTDVESCKNAIQDIEDQIEELKSVVGKSTYGSRMKLNGRIQILQDKIKELEGETS
jgi:peptidoglycan hydrolase CwlO-like protein